MQRKTFETLSDLIRGTPKPEWASLGEWRDWRRKAEAERPLRYWLAETALPWVFRAGTAPVRIAKAAKIWAVHRFFRRTHALTSRTLPRGSYLDLDQRILHCCFDALVDFVEVELGTMALAMDDDCPSTRGKRARAEAGLAHLRWEAALRENDEDPESEPSAQALGAAEILALHQWWTLERPKRKDPYLRVADRSLTKEERDRLAASAFKTEALMEAEDEAMLIRLIKARRHLWV